MNATSLDLPLSPPLLRFLGASLARDARGESPIAVSELSTLPRLGFDLDVVACGGTAAFRARCVEAARREDLVMVEQAKVGNLKLGIFDLSAAEGVRRWLVLDVVEAIRYSDRVTVRAPEVAGAWQQTPAGELFVPARSWRSLFALMQAVRKQRLPPSPRRELILAAADDVAVCGLIAERFGDAAATAVKEIGRGQDDTVLARLAERAGVRPYRTGPSVSPATWKTRLVTALRRGPFGRGRNSPFIAVLGPDGVGKSTMIEHMEAILGGYPLRMHRFHHTSAWKQPRSPGGAPQVQREGAFWRLVEAVKVVVPAGLRNPARPLLSELLYLQKVGGILADGHRGGRLLLSDRYVYDRWLKQYAEHRRGVTIGAARVSCSLLRRPSLAILLKDEPQRIRSRKQELSEEAIARYQQGMTTLCVRLNVPHRELRVEMRSPEALAREAVRHSLEALGPAVLRSAARWERGALAAAPK